MHKHKYKDSDNEEADQGDFQSPGGASDQQAVRWQGEGQGQAACALCWLHEQRVGAPYIASPALVGHSDLPELKCNIDKNMGNFCRQVLISIYDKHLFFFSG